MIHRRSVLVSLLVLLTLTTAAKAVNKEKLRRAVCLPVVTVFRGFYLNAAGFSLHHWREVPLSQQITALRKSRKGDATDAERYCRLGELYAKADQPVHSKKSYSTAAELCRLELRQHPEDVSWRLRLADALQGVDQNIEAEALLRQAIADAPQNWRCWRERARFLSGQWARAIMGSKPWHFNSPETLMEAIRAAQPTAEKITTARRYRQEADACYDRAVALAPREAEAYRSRAASRLSTAPIAYGLRRLKGEKADYMAAFLSADYLADMRRAVDLSPDDYAGIGAIACFEAAASAYQHHLRHPNEEPPAKMWDVLSASARKRLRADMARLEKGMADPDKQKAADAAEILGCFQAGLLEDYSTADKTLRRCLELDPARDNAWDMLTAVLAKAGQYAEASDLCRQHLKHKNSAHNRLLLAKTYEGLQQFDKAEQEIRAGLKHHPGDFMLNLAWADLLLMRAKDEDLTTAGKILSKLGKNYRHRPDPDGENHWTNYTFACGIFYGLIGDAQEARRRLEAVKRHEPNEERAKTALEALDE